jgi:hypothetical protein
VKPVGVFLGGEGPNELGSWSGDPVYQRDREAGVLEALLRRVQPDRWVVVGATNWRSIRKFRARGPSPAEERNVLGLVRDATEHKADVVAFVRDADDDSKRPAEIEGAIANAKQKFRGVDIIGGTAIPVLEGWILAMRGEHGTENLSRAMAQSRLEQDHGVKRKDTTAMSKVATEFDMRRLPDDAASLAAWLHAAQQVLPTRVRDAQSGG